MTIAEMHADVTAKLHEWTATGSAYDTQFKDRLEIAESVIRGEMKPQEEVREAARVAYLAAVDRLNAAGKAKACPGRPNGPAVIDPSEIPL